MFSANGEAGRLYSGPELWLRFHQLCAAVPSLTYLFSNGIVAVLHLVKSKGMEF